MTESKSNCVLRSAIAKALSGVVLATMVAEGGLAAEAAPRADRTVDEIVVTGIRGSLRDALEVKRNSDLVVDVISADNIGQLPDVTIAESINRLPGVNATRDRGNDSQAVVRGLGARLVLGTVNGREVASSEPDRNVRWEIYPSEVVSGVKVYKSQSADLIAGGVAATIDIATLQPLDYSGESLVLRGGPVYYEAGSDLPDYDPWGYRGSGSYVYRNTDETFGVVVGVTAQSQKNGYPSFTGWGYNDSNARPPEGASDFTGDLDGDGSPDATPWGAQISINGIDQERKGISLGTQWRPSDAFELRFDTLYSDIDIHEDQGQTVYGWNNWGNWNNGNWGDYNAPGASYTIVDGTVVAARLPFSSVTTVIADYDEDKELSVTGLNGRWQGERWSIAGDLSYSEAKRENIWQSVRTEVYPEWMSWDTRSGTLPTISTSQDPTTLPQFAPDYRGGSSDGPEHLNDELIAGVLDFTRTFDGLLITSIQFGARVSDRTKDHDRFEWSLAAPAGGVEIPANLFTVYNVDSVRLPPVLLGDFDEIARAAYGDAALDPSNATENLVQQWEVQEDVNEAYVKLNYAHDAARRMTGNVGVRFVDVQTTSEGYQQATGASALEPVSVDSEYDEILPSATLNLHLNEQMLLRFGASRVVSRPPLDELRASRTLTNWLPYTGNAGNPELEPFRATQFDTAWEWYFHDEALIGLSAYYKDVSSYIGWRQEPQTFDGITYAVSVPVNGSGGSIAGAEVAFQTPFFFWPALENFGVYSNYAYVDSDVKEFVPVTDPLTGVGFAEHTAVVDLWYSGGPLEVRVGYKYHSPFTVIYGWNGADLQRLKAESVVDVSTSYKLNSAVEFRLQVNNVTDEPLRIYRDNDPNRIGRYDEYGRRYLLDVTLKF